jgi:hypothetical protein
MHSAVKTLRGHQDSSRGWPRCALALRTTESFKKRNRHVDIGPYITFYFECYDTMWLQVQEMVYILRAQLTTDFG